VTVPPSVRGIVAGLLKTADVRLEIVAGKESTLRWMVAMWFTQLLAFAGMWLSRS
jgi:hypothetical protein